MGAYIYTRKKKTVTARTGNPYGPEVVIGLMTYHSKPYLQNWVAPVSKREQNRIDKIPYTEHVVTEIKNGATIYKMDTGPDDERNWSWDTPTIGKGEVGFLFKHRGQWIMSDMDLLDSIVSECSAFSTFLELVTRHPRPTLLVDSPSRELLADAFDAWQEANTWWKGEEYKHNRVYRRTA